MASPALISPGGNLEDPLAHLQCSRIGAFRKGQTIYNPEQPRPGLYLIIDGAVKVSRQTRGGRSVIIDLYQQDEFFGEASLIGVSPRSESAVAHENAKVMVWAAEEVEANVAARPRLAVALLQIMIQRELELTTRIESFSAESIEQRLAAALVRFSRRTGSREEDGAVGMPPFTHEFLAEYVGTSREIVTLHMNRFRRLGCVRYSRRGIFIYVEPLRAAVG